MSLDGRSRSHGKQTMWRLKLFVLTCILLLGITAAANKLGICTS